MTVSLIVSAVALILSALTIVLWQHPVRTALAGRARR